MDELVQEAVDFINCNIENDVAFVGFSGGKDSIVVAKLMEMSNVKYELYYSFTGLDAPEVVRFIRKEYPECRFLLPRRTFWRDLAVHIPPSSRIRWCCRLLKEEPAWKLVHKKRIMGIRSEESVSRSKRNRINYYKKLNHTHYYPIFHWKEWQIWEFINKYSLNYPKLYDWGFNRIGCIICPYHSSKSGRLHQMYRNKWTKFFELFEKKIKELYYKRKNQGKQMYYSTPEEFLDAWYRDSCARWYKN